MAVYNIIKAGGTSCGTPQSLDIITDEAVRLHEESLRQDSEAVTLFIVSATGSQKDRVIKAKNTDLLEKIAAGVDVGINIAEIKEREDEITHSFGLPGDFNREHFVSMQKFLEDGSIIPDERYSRVVTSVGELLKRDQVAAILNLKRNGISVGVDESSTGLYTSNGFRNAKFLNYAQTCIAEEFAKPQYKGKIAVIAGFTGIDYDTKRLTTLERGGSDTSAVIFGVSLKTPRIIIYSDSILRRCDPRIVPGAVEIDGVTYSEMEEFIGFGSNLVSERANDFAERNLVELVLRDTFRLGKETAVSPRFANSNGGVKGIAARDDLSLVVGGLTTEAGLYHQVTGILKDLGVSWTNEAGDTGCSSLILLPSPDYDLPEMAGKALGKIKKTGLNPQLRYDVTRIGLIGQSIGNHPEQIGKVFTVLSKYGLPVEALSKPINGNSVCIVTGSTYANHLVADIHDLIFKK